MQIHRFVKSFSQGQITIPKQFRTELNLGNDFWLKLTLKGDKIIAKPTSTTTQPQHQDYSQKLLRIKGDWFDIKDWRKIRQGVEQRLESR